VEVGTGGMAQAVEHQICKSKALSSGVKYVFVGSIKEIQKIIN
jgi:hypothetical protein